MDALIPDVKEVFIQTDFVFFTPVAGLYEDGFKVKIFSRELKKKELVLHEQIPVHSSALSDDNRYSRPINDKYPLPAGSKKDYRSIYEPKTKQPTLAFCLRDTATLFAREYFINIVWESSLGKIQIIWLPVAPAKDQKECVYKDVCPEGENERVLMRCAHTNVWDESSYLADSYRIADAERRMEVLAECSHSTTKNGQDTFDFRSDFGLGSDERRRYYLNLTGRHNYEDLKETAEFELCVFKPCRYAFHRNENKKLFME